MDGLVPGYWVGLALREEISGTRYYVGEIQHVDEHGIRITLVDWLLGSATSWDFYVPWSNVAGAHVATPEHDLNSFGEAAGSFQRAHQGPDEASAAATDGNN